jgi:hypothetical protein
MKLGKWVLGAVAAGLWLGSAQAAPLPVAKAPVAGTSGIEKVQFFFDDDPPPPPRGYYAPPPAYGYYDPPPRRYYDGPRREYYAPRPAYGYRAPPPAYGYRGRPDGMRDIARQQRPDPRFYSKDQVRAWNRMNGF